MHEIMRSFLFSRLVCYSALTTGLPRIDPTVTEEARTATRKAAADSCWGLVKFQTRFRIFHN